ncbi:hypothetical protein [Maricaulis sp.]|jgi:hypothetical protein|nr:hypothetical protein [Maricaulis sp.]
MGRKTYKAEEIIAHLREVEVRQSQGESIAAAVKAIGVTDQGSVRGTWP